MGAEHKGIPGPGDLLIETGGKVGPDNSLTPLPPKVPLLEGTPHTYCALDTLWVGPPTFMPPVREQSCPVRN